jgi:2-keto-4-pentenoate hydratase
MSVEPAPTTLAAARSSAISAAAQRLQAAQRSLTPSDPVRDLIGSDDIGAAYAVQQVVIEDRVARGASLVGRKIGLTSAAVQRQIGVSQPDFGVLLDDMRYGDGDELPADRLLQPRAEAEIAFVLGTDILDADVSLEILKQSVEYACPAIEVVDSRVRDWDIAITDTVADNASSGLFVLGDQRADLSEFEPRDVTMTMSVDGQELSSGSGEACLGDPLAALRWLAQTAIQFGSPLRAGDIVLSGALGPLVTVAAGQTITAHIKPLGTVTATFAKESTP